MSKLVQAQKQVLADARQMEQVAPEPQGPEVAPAGSRPPGRPPPPDRPPAPGGVGDGGGSATRPPATGQLASAMVELTLAAPFNPVDQPVELIQVSAHTRNAFDERATPEEKVAGVQLGHFGGFYKSSWRANDWMWGRLDGAYRLVQVLLAPGPLREALLRRSEPAEVAATLLATLRTIVVGDRDLAEHELLDLGMGRGTHPSGRSRGCSRRPRRRAICR